LDDDTGSGGGQAEWQRSTELVRRTGRLRYRSSVITRLLAIFYLTVDMERAVHWSCEAIDRSREQNYPLALGFALTFDGILNAVSGDTATATSRYTEAPGIQRRLDDKEGSGLSLGGLAQLASLSGDQGKAIKLYRESLAAFEAIGDRAEEARILSEIAWTHLARLDPSSM
jgi:hypothetical protein